MIRCVVSLACVCCFTVTANAAFEASRAIAPRTSTYDPLAPGALFWLANPATLSLVTPQFATAYTRPFGLAELETGIAAINFLHHPLAFGLGITTLGNSSLYRESDLNIAIAARLGWSISLGATTHLLDLRFGGYYPAWQLTAADLGVWYESPHGIGIGVSRCDQIITQPSTRDILTPVTHVALSYRYSPPLGLRAGAEYRDRWVFTCGETLLIAERIHLHADLLTSPLRIVVGARIRIPAGFITITHRNHPDLGGDLIIGWGTDF